ncbi:hypothetical protein K2173_020992 [Erythroxylum novogranatense]|uniref:Zinc knuckle CX2CX4HX4C domain-containing protein n=1 Tax=Erythroxylum novogranatense TaxID=1862640 RepID=A0AAV8TM83_9ROSI|nr:hypothetical protein K2173_020992 [Erythroxylum novogranatense]
MPVAKKMPNTIQNGFWFLDQISISPTFDRYGMDQELQHLSIHDKENTVSIIPAEEIQVSWVIIGVCFGDDSKKGRKRDGFFLEYDSSQRRNSWINYMRVRIRINVKEPLMRWKTLRKQGGDAIKITFSYERLPLICYLCSIIGHGETNCHKLLDRPEEEIAREWPEEIQAKVRARNARRKVQWKRDPGQSLGLIFRHQIRC